MKYTGMHRFDVLITEAPEGNWRHPAAQQATELHTVCFLLLQPVIQRLR